MTDLDYCFVFLGLLMLLAFIPDDLRPSLRRWLRKHKNKDQG